MSYNRHKQRNCGNRYPDAKYEYKIGSETLSECPKTFIKVKERRMIEMYDLYKSDFFQKVYIDSTANKFIELSETIEMERQLVDNLRRPQKG